MLSIAVVGCKKDKPGGDTQTGNLQTVVLKGRVSDANGSLLSGVTVKTGTLSAVTNAKGEFSFTQAEVIENRAVIKFEKSGYFSLTRSGVKENEMFIEAVLTQKGNSSISTKTTFNSIQASELRVGSMKVALPASSVVRADGSAYSGTVNADMLYLDPNNANFASMMPGGDLAGIDTNGKQFMLVSYGMTDVVLTDNSGNPLQLKSGEPAELTFPIPAGMENNPPATIPLWSFDEGKGIWVEEGVATLKGNVYVGTATHFSWVNLDVPTERVTIKGKVVDCENKPVSYVQVKVGQTAGTTNSKGDFSVFVPANTPVTVSVSANEGSDSRNVPGLQGGTVYTLPSSLSVPCGDDDDGEQGTAAHVEKGSIKYQMDGNLIIITFDNNGKRLRMDFLDNDTEKPMSVYLINHINKTAWIGVNSGGTGNWIDMGYDINTVPPDLPMFSIDEAAFAPYKTGTKTIANKFSCNIYTISQDGVNMTYAAWNGLIMLVEIDGEVKFMATDATLTVPESAFTKTFSITWI